jgi:hypothetical protein
MSSVINVRASIICVLEEIMSPAQHFFNVGDEILLIGCKVSEGTRYVVKRWGGCGKSAKEVRSSELGAEEAFVESSQRFESKTEPSRAVVNGFGGVKRNREKFTETVEAGDACPGQLGVRDIIVSERLTNVDGGDRDVVTESKEEFVWGRGLFRDAEGGEFKEWLSRRVSHGGGGAGRRGERSFV